MPSHGSTILELTGSGICREENPFHLVVVDEPDHRICTLVIHGAIRPLPGDALRG